ncbi:MAG: M18 family aminopeptidase [Gammaproteobacteria bacterium]|nr:M18 family aminopeptidase [Gammaproteobacteria bacterium]
MEESNFIDGLLDFIKQSPTPFHAVDNIHEILKTAGFVRLFEADVWDVRPGGSYYVIRNDSSIIAFTLGAKPVAEEGFRLVGAHTDSPCLKVKPRPEQVNKGYLQLGVEVYGGVLLNPWFDRDLSLAGRVSYMTKEQKIKQGLINLDYPIATIPSLAIHLDREANENRSINAQKHIVPVLMGMEEDEETDLREMLTVHLRSNYNEEDVEQVLDYELSFYDTQPPAVIGMNKDYIAGARLDNLLSCYVGLMSFFEAGEDVSCMLVYTDHEEVGSQSAAGAQGNFLRSVMQRIAKTPEDQARIIDRSVLISADNAHAIHPNYADKHDDKHGPVINQGPVIKMNSNQRYATNSETSAIFRLMCKRAEVPVQSFVVRSDMACGSTIGPITASGLGVKTVDIGVPTFGMHSIRELAGTKDAFGLYKALREFFNQ